MTKKRQITNKEFNEALRNEDYIRIISAASKKYTAFISPDDILECRMNALWQSLQNFDASFGVKFTSFLYSRVVWECKKKINVVNKETTFSCMDYFPAKSVENVCEIEDFLKQIPSRLRTAVYQRFFKNMTMEEIGKENNYSRETARRYINDGLDKIREIIS
jgi:RNA polymerase sigma factor (sigma-70 family)